MASQTVNHDIVSFSHLLVDLIKLKIEASPEQKYSKIMDADAEDQYSSFREKLIENENKSCMDGILKTWKVTDCNGAKHGYKPNDNISQVIESAAICQARFTSVDTTQHQVSNAVY